MDWINMIIAHLAPLFTAEKAIVLARFGVLLLVVLPAIVLIANWLRRYVTRRFSAQQGMIASKLFLYIGLFFVFFSVLGELGFKLTHLLGAAGVIGIAIGFASQTSIANIISGWFLIAEKPFQVNDIITVQEITGIVLSIDILSIKLRTFDNKYVRIPNEAIIKSAVTNVTHFPIRRVDLNVGVAYKEDIGRVREVLLDVAHHNTTCLNEPEPLVIFTGFGSSSLDLLLLVWAEKTDWLKLKNSIAEEVKQRFDEEGIEIPFPHVSLYSGSVTDPIPVSIISPRQEPS
jgi:small-conductance mechanosensitive channel